jgi:hypothetical protein
MSSGNPGVDLGDFSVVSDGELFQSHQPAAIFAAKYDKDLVRVDRRVSGWLARNRIEMDEVWKALRDKGHNVQIYVKDIMTPWWTVSK